MKGNNMIKNKLHVSKQDFPTYFDFTRNEIVDLMTLTGSEAVEYQESIRTKLLYELQQLYVERVTRRHSVIYLYDLISAFLGCSDVIVEEK